MELIDQHTKTIMEGCKERAREAGLRFHDETLEYIVTNRDLLELSPKGMIPTLYDYWVNDVEVLKEKGRYELYPHNPYETVINTRPPISFYNDNNPDWLNVMIFYHVLAHVDFFQNNFYFRHTWDDDFAGQALSDKRLIARLRSDKGRFVDYVIEFARGMDNLVGYYQELDQLDRQDTMGSKRIDYYFDVFIQENKIFRITDYIKEIERYNDSMRQYGDMGERSFFSEVDRKFPEFEALFRKSLDEKPKRKKDPMQFVLDHSVFLQKEENQWMKSVIQVVRNTSVFFQPQIRTKIMNEGWASYWHEQLFLEDDRIKGHEVDFARTNAMVTSLSRVGLNPYALGMRLFQYMEELADRGKHTYTFQKLADAYQREKYDTGDGRGREFIFRVRETMSDFTFINSFVDQDFINRYQLFVAGKRLSENGRAWQYYVKSRKADDYRQMLFDSLYHPPHIEIALDKTRNGDLYLIHHLEGKPLITEFISNTMLGIEYLWGGPVHLETSEVLPQPASSGYGYGPPREEEEKEPEIKWQRVLYTMKGRKLAKKNIGRT